MLGALSLRIESQTLRVLRPRHLEKAAISANIGSGRLASARSLSGAGRVDTANGPSPTPSRARAVNPYHISRAHCIGIVTVGLFWPPCVSTNGAAGLGAIPPGIVAFT